MAEPRPITFARVSDGLRAALGPALDDPEDLSAMAGVDVDTLKNILEGVPRRLTVNEQTTVRRLALLVCWLWQDGVLVEIQTQSDTPAGAKSSTDVHDSVLNTTSKENER